VTSHSRRGRSAASVIASGGGGEAVARSQAMARVLVLIVVAACWHAAVEPPAPATPAPEPAAAPPAHGRACAQTGALGTIVGTVSGASAAPLPGVTIVAQSPALGDKQQVVITDENGRYRFADLPGGRYELSFYYADAVVQRRTCVRHADTIIDQTIDDEGR